MTDKNYFIIQNGTQLLNAIEYAEHNKLRPSDNLLIIVSTTDIIYHDLNIVISESEHFNEVRRIFPKFILQINRHRLGRILSIIYARNKIASIARNNINNLIIGNYQNMFCRLFVKKSISNKIIVVDDGPATIDIFNSSRRKLSRFNNFIEKILNIKEYGIQPDVIFTRFSKQLKEKLGKKGAEVQIIDNNFVFLKKDIDNKEKSLDKLFVGYPFVEEAIFSINEYVDLLNSIKKKVGDFIYVPHRRESQESLNYLSKYFQVKNLGMPFELYLYKFTVYPGEIIGFFSTVLFNVNQMFGDKIKLKYIRIEHLEIVHVKNLKNLYDEIDQIAELVLSIDYEKKDKFYS